MDNIELLKQTSLVKGFTDEELTAIDALMQEKEYEAHKEVFPEGAPGDCLYLIKEGAVKITKKSSAGVDKVLSLLKEGDVFGEFAIADGSPRSAAAKTLQPTKLLILYVLNYQQLVNENVALAMKLLSGITEVITSRLRSADDKVVNAVMWGSQKGGGGGGETSDGDSGGSSGGDTMSIKRLISDRTEVKVTFPDGELLGRLRSLGLNEANLPEIVLADSTGHTFIIPYHSIKYIVSLEKKKSTSRFL